jgi:hypothetical protein
MDRFWAPVAPALKISGKKSLTTFQLGIVVRCCYRVLKVGWKENAELLWNVLYKSLNTAACSALRLYKTTASRCGKSWEWICWKMLKAADKEWFYTMGIGQEAASRHCKTFKAEVGCMLCAWLSTTPWRLMGELTHNSTHFRLEIRLRWIFQLHVPAVLSLEEKPPLPIGQEAWCTSERVRTRWRREDLFARNWTPISWSSSHCTSRANPCYQMFPISHILYCA